MDLVRKVLVPEDVHRVLVTGENALNDLFIRRFQCTAEVTGPRHPAGSLKVYEKWLNSGPRISVWRDDLTRQDADVVVNAANEWLDHMAGLALALVEAGGQQIVLESRDLISRDGQLAPGDIAVTSAGKLPSKKIVHAVGPRWSEGSKEKCKAQLEEAIKKVLGYVSDHSDLHSVAIPAVSSGIFGFPLDLCGRIIVTTISTFCSKEGKSRLKEIRLVNHDDKTVQAMKTACEQILGSSDMLRGDTSSSHSAASSSHSAASSPHSTASSSHSTASSSHSAASSSHSAASSSHSAASSPHWQHEASSQMFLSINGLNLHLKTGRIEEEKTDVIVNSVSPGLNLSYGAISAAINEKAGHQLQKEIRTKQYSNVITTCGYNLSCRHVYHVILPAGRREAEKTLQEVTRKCLMTAHSHRSSSISFPALGTGNIGLHKHTVADIMTQAVLDFARGSECRMDVYFVIHPTDRNTLQAFQDKFKASWSLNNKNVEPRERQRGPEPSADGMYVRIAGESGHNVMEADTWLQDVLFSSSLIIDNNHLLLFGSNEFEALASASLSADIEEELKDGRVSLKISGSPPDRVMAAVQVERLLLDVQDELTESLEEELLEATVIWFYEDLKYPAKATRELEKAYVTRTNVTLSASPGHMIDIMNLTAKDGKRTYCIQRQCLHNIQTSPMTEQWPSQTKQVDQNSQEFRDRSNEFRKAGLTLVKMEKVQNKLLSRVFQSKKEAVEERRKKPSTEQLYQLVPRQFWKKICDVGFHKLYVTPRETKYGAGIYFKKSLHNIKQRFYSPEKDGLLYILQAEVVTGVSTKCTRNQPVLPCVGPDALQVYESLTDGGLPVEHYVIFDRFLANPQYVFTCKTKE